MNSIRNHCPVLLLVALAIVPLSDQDALMAQDTPDIMTIEGDTVSILGKLIVDPASSAGAGSALSVTGDTMLTGDLSVTETLTVEGAADLDALLVAPEGPGSGLKILWNLSGDTGETDFINYGQDGYGGFAFYNHQFCKSEYPDTTASNWIAKITSSGDLHITGSLYVAGSVNVGSSQSESKDTSDAEQPADARWVEAVNELRALLRKQQQEIDSLRAEVDELNLVLKDHD